MLNSQPRTTMLRDFQNQEYRLTIPKSRTRLAEKLKKKKKNTGSYKTLYASRKRNNFSAITIFIDLIPQGSTHGPLLFHLFINDVLFFFIEKTLSNYTDNSNLFRIRKDLGKIKALLVKYFGTVTNWFHENFMVLNSKRFVLENGENKTFTFKDVCHENNKEKAMLGINIELTLDSHVRKCEKSGQNLNALSRIPTVLDNDKKKRIFDIMIKSQFSYCR